MLESGKADDPIWRLAQHALGSHSDSMDSNAVAVAQMIILDTVAVGIAGSAATYADAVHGLAPRWGGNGVCRVLGRGRGLPAATAAFLNAYQIHGQEFDCVHEPAVVHPMAAVMAAALAELEQLSAGSDTTGVSGAQFLSAVSAGVDVAIAVGLSARVGLRFFRPATAGAFGAAAVAARLRGMDLATTVQVFGHLYSQLCGTMQAHSEGAAVLPMQIGFNARNAVVAADLASAGISAPEAVISGPYGYLELFEPDGDISDALDQLDKTRRITELSYKPFPTGRATHGGLDGILSLRAQHGLTAAQIESVRVFGPPLIPRLVGRSVSDAMPANTARLCMQYVGAVALVTGTVGLFDFSAKALSDPDVMNIAQRLTVIDDGNPDPNALLPQRVEISLFDGQSFAVDLPEVLGSPQKNLDEAAKIAKIRHCCDFAGLAPDRVQGLIDGGKTLAGLADVGDWLQYAWQPGE
ncbi:MAG: MmgE/PrpD family protein [Burkholderiaceae bacterium]